MTITIKEIVHEYIALISLAETAEITAYAGKIEIKPKGIKAKESKDCDRQNRIRTMICRCIAEGPHVVYTAKVALREDGGFVIAPEDMQPVKDILDFAVHLTHVDMIPDDRLTTRFIHNLPDNIRTAIYDSSIEFAGV